MRAPAGDFNVQVEPIGDVRSKLSRTYRITNAGDHGISDFSVTPVGELVGRALVWPAVDAYVLEAGDSVEITVGPHLVPGFSGASGEVRLAGGGHEQRMPVSFRIPEGKQIFLARGASSSIFTSILEFCTNAGGGEAELAGPTAVTSLCDFLRNSLEDADHFQSLYENAPGFIRDPNHLQDWVQDEANTYYLGKYGKQTGSGGSTDPETWDIECPEEAYAGMPEPQRSIALEGCLVHETSHSHDAISDREFQRMSDGEYLERFRQSEIDAYEAQLGYLGGKLAELCGGGGAEYRPGARGLPLRRAGSTAPTRAGQFATFIPGTPGGDLGARWGPQSEYFLLASFELVYSRSVYTPHDTAIAINGNEVARLESMMPEGTYALPVDPRWLSPVGRNVVSVSTTGMNGAHYLLANRFQIVASVTDGDRYVVATSQEEADRLYASLSSINHDRPDLAIVAKPNVGIPARPADGEEISFAVTAINLGEAPAPSARLRVLNYDPRERAASDVAGPRR